MTSFDACRFDFRLDDKKGLTPAYRRRHLHPVRLAVLPNSTHTNNRDDSPCRNVSEEKSSINEYADTINYEIDGWSSPSLEPGEISHIIKKELETKQDSSDRICVAKEEEYISAVDKPYIDYGDFQQRAFVCSTVLDSDQRPRTSSRCSLYGRAQTIPLGTSNSIATTSSLSPPTYLSSPSSLSPHISTPPLTTPISGITRPQLIKPAIRRQRKRKAHLAGSGQLTMCSYCSALFDNRKNLLSHQLTDAQCRQKQESKDGHVPNSQYRLAVLRKLKRLTNNKVAQRLENRTYEDTVSSGDQSVSLGTMSLLRDLVKQPPSHDTNTITLSTPPELLNTLVGSNAITYSSPFNSIVTPLSPFATPLEPLPFPVPEQSMPTNLSTHKRTAVVAPQVNFDLPIDLSLHCHKPRAQNNLDLFHTARLQLKPRFKSSSRLSLKEISSTKCNKCGMVVSRPSFMSAHMRRWHGEEKCTSEVEVDLANSMQCLKCSFSCKNTNVFREHTLLEHP